MFHFFNQADEGALCSFPSGIGRRLTEELRQFAVAQSQLEPSDDRVSIGFVKAHQARLIALYRFRTDRFFER